MVRRSTRTHFQPSKESGNYKFMPTHTPGSGGID
jgi:hypothetical protein